jgi:hypothetical protein
MMCKPGLLLVLGACCWAAASTVHAQQQILAMPRVGGYAAAADDSLGAGGVGRPSVSPYSNLALIDELGISGGYQTLVQPFVYQRQATLAQQSSIHQLQRQVTTIESAPKVQPMSMMRPNQIIRDTGHQTRSMNYSHYFPTASVQ